MRSERDEAIDRLMTHSPLFMLSRRSDPSTSHRAAHSINLQLNAKHHKALAYLHLQGPLTDDQLADALVRTQVYARHEQARRAIRTLRENYGLIVPVLNADGTHAEGVNSSGRSARLWTVEPEMTQ